MSMGVRLPIIKENDDITRIIADRIERSSNECNIPIDNGDIIGITESIVARSAGLYVSVDDVAKSVMEKFDGQDKVYVLWPIYSRNRFSLILKGIAKGTRNVVVVLSGKDEVGNDLVNQFTGVDIVEFYRNLIKESGAIPIILKSANEVFQMWLKDFSDKKRINVIQAACHPDDVRGYASFRHFVENGVLKEITLGDLCDDVNPDFGLFGSNKATEDTLKLFPTVELSKTVALGVQERIMKHTGKHVEVLIYGDGCFKDPVGGIWELADPVSSPYYTDGLEGTPNELKLKYIADNESADEDFIVERIKHKKAEMAGQMITQGTTPRMYRDLVASLCDLTSGSGDKGTPVVWIKNYFKNYAD